MSQIKEAWELMHAGKAAEALPLFTAALDEGNGWGALYLGWIYQMGKAGAKDPAAAERLYKRAFQLGVGDGAYYLGALYMEQRRYEEALSQYQEAVRASSNPSAAYWTYRLLEEGKVVTPNGKALAQTYLRTASKLGHVFARRDYAKLMMKGRFGMLRIPKGLLMFIGNLFRGVKLAVNTEDYRLR